MPLLAIGYYTDVTIVLAKLFIFLFFFSYQPKTNLLVGVFNCLVWSSGYSAQAASGKAWKDFLFATLTRATVKN